MPEELSAQPSDPSAASLSAWAPLRLQVFRMLWGTWLAANICMWMNDVAAAWLMTSMTTLPIWVALVQSASTLPVFLLGLPSGALADILDRRRYFIATQFWVAGVATLLCITVIAGVMTPPLLLGLTFANGIGLAMRWPVFAAIVPELVPRAQLPAALALNGVAMNASRIVGPLVAGALIASAGIEYVFVLNAVLSVLSGLVIMRWRRTHVPSPLGRERLTSAMRVGLQFVRQSRRLRTVLLQVSLFFLHSTALLALLPLVARNLQGGDAATFTLLLAAMGSGAIVTAIYLPRLRQMMPRDTLVLRATLVQSVSTAVMALAPNIYVAVPAMLLNGMAWISCANSLSVSAQLALPDWVRARGMSMYQMAIMGASALGAALWGQVATVGSVQTALGVAAVSGTIAMLLAQRLVLDLSIEEDLTPSREFKAPVADAPPGMGQVIVTIEYLIEPARADEFRALMQESRRSRLRQGALDWALLRDIGKPGRYVEQIIDESWTEHLRRFDRVTTSDVTLRERKLAFHIGDGPPLVQRCVVEGAMRV
ncbi:MAG: arabinose ABC transporter permease [Polaromonas sp. 39-63-203]|jgi:MFS family permease|uniref:MFS transporter n=1 Tax=Polaromonas sp. TaxID=1869339 RepID=UPI000BDCDAAB|nr:MFS transporter [Polaromonas sp.]OYY54140.1 MAG: arabinose ABC transporter permease [Polaromonas sp. 35-63-240]OYZ03541.1 MAG: arabinose ABC transporter permease [Polaromonas sp. 28-63-22]OYZ85321.1 MAG: arabinose ABC transporter permease [Polaromonas sp. 24-62-144]OZB02512.1 MAG: arabinose ABC transporter permease [Polaromonas sp. 39-63-203]HQS31930.1 MFS transporter [Polaromonas sp.]